MKKGRRRWLWFLLVLLIGACLTVFVLYRKKQKQSLGLAEQIPQAQWLGQLNVIRLMNSSFPELEFPEDSGARKFDLRNWDFLLRNPMKLGLDIFSNPWFYGSDSNFCILTQLADTQRFVNWLRQDVEDLKSIQWSANGSYSSAFVMHDHLQFAWDNQGKLLVVISLKNSPTGEVERYFNNEHSRDLSDWSQGGSLVKFKLNHELIPAHLARYSAWLPAGEYALDISKKSFTVNSKLWDVEEKHPLDIRLSNAALSQKELWSNKTMRVLLGDRIGVKDVSDEPVPRFAVQYAGLDSSIEYHRTYEYDDDFNKIEIVDSTMAYLPNWRLELQYKDPQGFAAVPEELLTGEGMLQCYVQKTNESIICSNKKSDLPVLLVDNKENSFIYLKYDEIVNLQNKLGVETTFLKYGFIDRLVYQANDSAMYFKLSFK